MKSFIVAFVVVAALLFAVVDGKPHMPKRRICSIQATGTAKFKTKFTGIEVTGTCSMKRVNGYAMYNYSKEDVFDYYGYILVRADVGENDKTCEKAGSTTNCQGTSGSDKYSLDLYEYSEDYNPIPEMKDYYCFVYKIHSSPYAAMLFTKDERMKLVAEWFKLGEDKYVSLFYDNIQEYEHDYKDRTFSLDDGSKWSTVATEALTRYCNDVVSSTDPSSSGVRSSGPEDASNMILPSFVAFIAAMVVDLLF